MSSTYSHIPKVLSEIFAEIVAEVSANLASEAIPQVSFKHGTWLDIATEIKSDAGAPSKKNIIYPLICLIYKTDERFTDKYNDSIEVDLMICTRTNKNWTNTERVDNNITPVLYPIYAELKSVIGKCKHFWGWKRKFDHIKTDLLHAGQSSGQSNSDLEIQDFVDGIYLRSCRFKVAQRAGSFYEEPNLCLLTPCQYGIDEYFTTVFKNVSIGGIGTAILSVSVNDWEHFDNTVPMALPLPWAPEIDWQGIGSFVSLNPGATASDPWTGTFDTTTGFGDGVYRGMIKNGDAQVEFYYKITAGVISIHTSLIEQDIAELNLACSQYPNYPITVNARMKWAIGTGQSSIMQGYSLKVFGETKKTETFTATNDYTVSTETTATPLGTDESIQNLFSFSGIGSQTPLQLISIHKTRCKTSF